MADSKTSKKDSNSNDGLALIIGGLFVLALVFATYSYFNRSNTLDEQVKSGTSEISAEAKEKTASSLGERLRELFRSDDEGEGSGGPLDMVEEGMPGTLTFLANPTQYLRELVQHV